MKDDWPIFSQRKLVPPPKLINWASEIRGRGKTIATLNGSFDLLHSGHLHILFEASRCCDVLIVALNTDDSIKRYKGENRPFIPLEERLKMLSAISFIDFITWFDEDDPKEFIRSVRPDVHVNGHDWGADCVEKETVDEVGAKLHIVSLKKGLSTTNIVEKIHAATSTV